MKLKLKVWFPGAGDWTELTHLVRHGSKSINRRLMNDDHKSVVDSFRLQLKHDNDLINSFFAYNGRILAEVAEEDDTPVFNGYVAPTFNQATAQVVSALDIEILDNSYLLDEKLAESFQYPATIGATPYKILDKDDTEHSIIHQLLDMAGYPVPDIVSASCPNITQTILHIAGTKDDETYRDLIDVLLFEYGYVFYFTEAGTFMVYQWDADVVTPTVTIQENYGTAEGLRRTKKDSDYDGVRVEWSKTTTLTAALLYRENLPLSTAGGKIEFTGVDIADDDYFPTDGDIEDLYQDFVTQWLDIPYLERKTRLHNKDITLITTSDHSADFTAETGIAIDSQSFESHRAKVLFRNTGGATKKLYTFEVTGKALYRSARKYRKAPSTSKLPQEYVSRHIYDSTAATRLTHALRVAQKYGDFAYTWTMREDLAPGVIVTINLANPSMSTTAIVVSWERNFDQPMRRYTAIGISAYETFTSVISGGQGGDAVAQQNFIESAISVVPSMADLQDGYTGGGGTTIPTVPTPSAHGLFGAIHLSWDRQMNLTNFSRYELQVSPDAGANWYPVDLDGDGYDSGSPGGDTDLVIERLIHTKIPHGGTDDEPTVTTYTYRIRRVTKSEVASSWSAEVNATTLLVANGDIPANLILANKVETGFLNAIIAEIQSYLAISGDYGWLAGHYVAPGAGDQRAYMDKNEFRLQIHSGAAWQNRFVVVASNGTDNYIAYLLSCSLGIGTSTPDAPLHIYAGAAGGTAHAYARLIVEDDTYAMISIRTPSTAKGYYGFSDQNDECVAGILYDHSTNAMELLVNDTVCAQIISSGVLGLAGDAAITSAPPASAPADSKGWKLGFYGATYALGVAAKTMAAETTWLSTFLTTYPADDGTDYQPDTNSRASIGPYGLRHGEWATVQAFSATNRYVVLGLNAYYRSGWKRTTAASGAMRFSQSRSESDDDMGTWVWALSTDAGDTVESAITWESQMILEKTATVTNLDLGGAAGGSDRSVNIRFTPTQDTVLYWSEPNQRFNFNVAGVNVAQFGETYTKLLIVGISQSADMVAQGTGLRQMYRNTSSIRFKRDVEALGEEFLAVFDRLRPVKWRSLLQADDPDSDYYGFVAEEVAALGYSQMVHWDTDEDGNRTLANGVQTGPILALAVAKVQDHETRLRKLEEVR